MATHPCEWAHEGESCSGSALRFLPGAVARALPVYLPVYVLPAILVHRSGAFPAIAPKHCERCLLARCPSWGVAWGVAVVLVDLVTQANVK